MGRSEEDGQRVGADSRLRTGESDGNSLPDAPIPTIAGRLLL
jgi:hypothetical protein